MRIAKYIAAAGIASRRQADTLVQEGKVTVNGQVVSEPWQDVDPQRDTVAVNGRVLENSPLCYVMLNKPVSCLSAVSDSRGRKTVVDLVPGVDARLFPVGRLDYDSEGLLLLTNDGDLANRLMHPRFGVNKTYQVLVEGVPRPEILEKLRQGILLEDGLTHPAQVRMLGSRDGKSELEIVIHEGRKRQVKRMFAAVGHPVSRLVRVGYAFLQLGGLQPGESRFLTADEIDRLRQISQPKK